MDFGYKVNKGIIEFFDGEKRITTWNNSIITKLLTVKKIKRSRSLTELEFSIEKGKIKIFGRITVPDDFLLGVEYLGPLGNKFYCYNSAIADLELVVSINGEIQKHVVKKNVAFETVYKSPQFKIKYLPWESEEIN